MDNFPEFHTDEALAATQEQLRFISPDAIEVLRQESLAELRRARQEALQDLSFADILSRGRDITAEVEKAIYAGLDTRFESYLSAHANRDEQPERFDRMLALLNMTSIQNMDSEEWYLGETDDEGNHSKIETSGVERVRQIYNELCGEPGGDGVEASRGELDAELDEARTALAPHRACLAELSIARRRLILKDGPKASRLEDEYEQAVAEYQAAYERLSTAALAILRDDGASDEDIRNAYILGTIDERRAFTEAEAEALGNDDSMRAKVANWLAKRSHLLASNAASGAALGYGTKKLIKGATALAVAPALPVALGVGTAVKTTKAVLNATVGNRVAQTKLRTKRADEDIAAMSREVQEGLDGHDIDELVTVSSEQIMDSIDVRIENDRRYNRNRVLMAAAVSCAFALAGALVADHIHLPNHGVDKQGHFTPKAPSHPAAPVTPSQAPAPVPTNTYGFTPNVLVENGHGYTQELQELAAQRGVHLNGNASYRLYDYLESRHGGNLFTNIGSYHMGNDFGINAPGAATWRPEVLHDIDNWIRWTSVASSN